MRLRIELNKKSIENAKKTLEVMKKQLQGEMLEEFYNKCFDYFVEQCNMYLSIKNIGENVKSDINNSWHYERTEKGARFYNDSEKAVYVEFGVGIVGKENKHSNADEVGYNYSVGTKIKDDGTWIFNVSNDDDIDIQEDYIINRTTNTVKTKGSPAIMYAFQALEDLRIEYPKIWENIKVKYWG